MEFILTANDVAWLTALIRGQEVAEGIPGYRSLSGYGNNIENPTFGAADNPFIRITDPRYGTFNAAIGTNGLGNYETNPIFTGLDPRAISNVIGQQEASLPKAASGANLLFSAFGQYVDHGLDFLAKGKSGTVLIGAPGLTPAPGSNNPADLSRGTVVGFDENLLPQHLNKTANFVEQNQTYGSNDLVGTFLRETDGSGGITANLAVGGKDPSNPSFSLLPSLRELILLHWENNTLFTSGDVSQRFREFYPTLVQNGVINDTVAKELYSDFMNTGQALLIDLNPFISPLDHIVAGDGRLNENVTLTAIHTIWARNHNFHVENLLNAGFVGTAEELFQAAKIINEAEYQRVVFTEFTDVLLGGMRGNGSHGWDGYDPDVNPAISHEFAAAAYRFGHSIVTQTIQVADANGQITDIALFDAFLNPTDDGQFQFNGQPVSAQFLAQYGYVPQPGYEQLGVGSILKGISQQAAEEADVNVVDALRNDLVRVSADLFSFNVARGRDVGLGTLNQVRLSLMNSDNPYIREAIDRWAGNLTPYASWEDFQLRNNLSDGLIAQFKAAYPDLVLDTAEIASFVAANPDILLVDGNTVKGIDRVDLWVGGLAEAHINGGMVGQTFWVILHEQFDRLQEADRFYYLDRVENFDFYRQIDGLTGGFGAIIARNTGMEWNGLNVFLSDPDVLTYEPPDPPAVNDNAREVSILPAGTTVLEGNTGQSSTHTFTVTISQASPVDTVVNWSVTGSGPSAADAADFGGTLPSGQVTILAGQTSANIVVNASGDTTLESNDSFTVTLTGTSAGTQLGANVTATSTILNDEARTVSISGPADGVLEGNSGSSAHTFTVTMSSAALTDTVVNWSVAGAGGVGLSAADSADFGGSLPSGTVTILAGQTSATFNVNATGDLTPESNDSFTVTLTGTSAGTQLGTTLTANSTIIDDEGNAVSISGPLAPVTEGNTGTAPHQFAVRLERAVATATVVNYAVLLGSGAGFADAADLAVGTPLTGTVTIAAGQTEVILDVLARGDSTFEPNETFTVSLTGTSAGTQVSPTNGSATSTIANDDPEAPPVNFGPSSPGGNGGNNVVNGGAAADTMFGGNGNDTLNGHGENDVLHGEAGADNISGGDGDDTLTGGIGNDTISGGSGNDSIDGGAGNDRLLGGDGNDTIISGGGTDIMNGDAGDDVLVGGTARQTMTGGEGADVFRFNKAITEIGTSTTTNDIITDFTPGVDKIDLSAIDADTRNVADSAFLTLIKGNAAFTAPGQLKLVQVGTTTNWQLQGNVNTTLTPDFIITLQNFSAEKAAAVTLGDFIL